MEKLNLWQKISLIMKDVNYVQKNMTVGEGKNSYKGTRAEDVFSKINESMVQHGVVCVQKSFTFERFYYEGERIYNDGNVTKTFQREIVGTYKGCLINVDNPEEREEISAIGQGIDPQDKASGKAQTYAMKQALLDTFIVSTGTDTDNTDSDELTKQFAGNQQVKNNQKPELTEKHKHFKLVCDGIKEGKTTIEKLMEKYVISKPVLIILNKIVSDSENEKTI